MANRRFPAIAFVVGALCATCTDEGAHAQQAIGSTAVAQNQVSRELAGAARPLAVGDFVYRNEVVRTGADSTAKLVFVDFDQPRGGADLPHRARPVRLRRRSERRESRGRPGEGRVPLYDWQPRQEGLHTTPTAAIGVRGTVLDIAVRSADTGVTLVEGLALLCPRKAIGFDQQARNCAAAFGGAPSGHCDCAVIDHPGQTATARRVGGTTRASLTSTPVNFVCAG